MKSPRSQQKKVVFMIGLGLVGGVFGMLRFAWNSSPPAPLRTSTQAILARENPVPRASAGFGTPEKSEGETQGVREAFQASGWREVTAPEPDPEVLALSPSLRGPREKDIRLQLRTAALSGDQLQAAIHWLNDPGASVETRQAALDAVIRAGEAPRAQAALAELVVRAGGRPEETDSVGRTLGGEALGALLPRSLGDPAVEALLGVLQAEQRSRPDREQAAFTLALWLAREPQLASAVEARVSSAAARSLLRRMQQQVQSSSSS